MDELKQQGFVSWLSQILEAETPEDLDTKIKELGEDKINLLAIKFNNEIWPVMSEELKKQEKVTYAKLGTKLNFITRLNGDCPEGYEVEKFMIGGKPCSRCKKKIAMKMKAGSTMDAIKSEIEAKKCGGKAKKMQTGGKPYNEDEHARLIEAYQKGKIKLNSKEHQRLLELNRNAPNQDPAWSPKKNTKKVKLENKKRKYLPGGTITPYSYQWDLSIFNSKNRKPVSKLNTPQAKEILYNMVNSTDDTMNTTMANARMWYNNPQGISSPKLNTPPTSVLIISPKNVNNVLDTTPKAIPYGIELPEVLITPKKSNNLGGGLYEWMVKNGLANKASFAGRKALYKQILGSDDFVGTADQNGKLLEALKIAQTYNQASNGRY